MAVDLIEKERLNQHRQFLEDNIDPDFGLLDKLSLKGTLTQREISAIRARDTFYQRNILLLDYILKQNKFNNLLDALRETNQVHLVNYVINNGEYRAEEIGDEWPLTDVELSTFSANQDVLVDLIEPGDLVGRLYSRDVINRRQRDAISSKLPCHEKNEALLEILRRQSLRDFKVTIRCLRESNQSHIAEILQQRREGFKLQAVPDFSPKGMGHTQKKEHKGTLQSAKSNPNGKGSTIADETIREMQEDEWQDISGDEEGNAEGDMKDDDWSEDDQSIGNEDKQKLKPKEQITEDENPAMDKPKVNKDFEQFEKTVVFFSIANFTSKLDLKRREGEKVEVWGLNLRRRKAEFVRGVTKLRNKIHVLLDRSSTLCCLILVFEDQIPFRLQKIIEIKEIKKPRDIASIETDNFLYVLELKCVWRITEGDKKEKKEIIIRWLELKDYHNWPWTLSVTGNGQLLIVGRKEDNAICSLRMYGGGGSEKAYLCRSVPLPEDIQRPHHAVETSKGNFIIIHKLKIKTSWWRQKEEWMDVISEVSGDGKTILRRFIPKNEEQVLGSSILGRLLVDSLDRVFLADFDKSKVILLDSDLHWDGILIPREGIWSPCSLFYDEEKQELIVGGIKEVFVYILNKNKK